MPRPCRRDLAALLLLLAALGGAFHALTSPVGMPSGDHVDFYLWVHQVHAELAEGHWPQVLPDAIRGGGHAFPRFYPPLAQAAAALAYPVTGNIVLASHLSVLAGVLLSAVTIFVLLRALGAGILAATLGAAVYCLFPYRATQLYVRGAFAEGWAMAWYPLVMLGVVRWTREGRLPWWWPLAVAATLLSHTASSLWALPAIGLVGLLAAPRLPDAAAWRSLAGASALSIGLAAFSLLPVAWYLPGVRAAEPGLMAATVELIGATGNVWRRLGPVAALELVIVAGAIALIRAGRGKDDFSRLLGWGLLGHAALLAMSAAPAGAWALVPQPWRYVQFGWRLLAPATFLAALAFGLLSMRFVTGAGRATVALAGALIALGGAARLRSEGLHDPSLTQSRIVPWIGLPYGDYGMTAQGDYLPREANPDRLGPRIAFTRDSLEQAGALTLDAHGRPATVRTSGAADVPLPLVAYDVFRVTDEGGRGVPTRSDAGQLVAIPAPTTRELRISRRLP
ncbi:MAG TPA: hypothetical protein VJ773_06510, partial [Gemmatimonadales bacterium]|nr:hypothetical protein [Gemmatimonadales bacterium]